MKTPPDAGAELLARLSIEDLASLPMSCDCTKSFEDWPLSDQLVAKAREAIALRSPPSASEGMAEALRAFMERAPENEYIPTKTLTLETIKSADYCPHCSRRSEHHQEQHAGDCPYEMARAALQSGSAAVPQLKEASAAQHFDLPKGTPAQFVRGGVLETCQCSDCRAVTKTPLQEALDLAVNIIMANEPGDSRAVSDEAVALASVACGDTSEPVMSVIRAALSLPPTEAGTVSAADRGTGA